MFGTGSKLYQEITIPLNRSGTFCHDRQEDVIYYL